MGKLQWFFTRIAEKVGLIAGLAWLLLIAIALYSFYIFLPVQQKLNLLEQQLEDIPVAEHVVYAYISPSEDFFSKIPHLDSVALSIKTIFKAAKKQNITINEVAYKDEQRLGESLVRYSMSFSIAASYPETKMFVTNALAALPYLSLEQLTFERDDLGSNNVMSHIRFTLYLVH